MKKHFKILSAVLLIVFVCLSCNKSDDNDGAPPFNSFVKYSIHGPSINGNYEIRKTQQQDDVVQTCFYIPENPENEQGSMIALSMMDNAQLLSFSLVAPGMVKLTEIIKDNPHSFQIAFGFEELALEAGTVSVNVTTLDIDSGFNNLVTHVKGNFEGVVLHIYEENGEEIQESHTVNGNFEYVPF